MGAEAALAVLDAKADTDPCVICLDGNKIAKRPLMECVEKVSFFFRFIWQSLSDISLNESKNDPLRYERNLCYGART